MSVADTTTGATLDCASGYHGVGGGAYYTYSFDGSIHTETRSYWSSLTINDAGTGWYVDGLKLDQRAAEAVELAGLCLPDPGTY